MTARINQWLALFGVKIVWVGLGHWRDSGKTIELVIGEPWKWHFAPLHFPDEMSAMQWFLRRRWVRGRYK